MAEQPTLLTLTSLANATTAINQLNTNFANIGTAFEDVLSLSGVAPNQILSTLDMNSNRQINLPSPISVSEPVTLGYMNNFLATGQGLTGLTGVPVSAAMQPVVANSTLAGAMSALGISSAMQPVVASSTTTAGLEALGVSAAMFAVISAPTTLAGLQTLTFGNTNVKVQFFTSSGTYNPTSGMAHCIVECVGGGGGGGGTITGNTGLFFQGGGGGSGGYSRKYLTSATVGSSQAVIVGTGGAGGSGGSPNGIPGLASSFGTLCKANGGAGGIEAFYAVQIPLGGVGANLTGAVGDITVQGTAGTGGLYTSGGGGTSPTLILANGGPGPFGGRGGQQAFGIGTAAVGYGAGGNGGVSNYGDGTSYTGGAGAAGIVIVTEFINL